MKRKNVKSYLIPVLIFAGITAFGCSGPQRSIHIEPGKQAAKADVNFQSASVTMTKENVEVAVRGVILPDPNKGTLHPTFWVTVKNNRKSKIDLNPAKARLVDSFGNQYRPLPMSLENGDSKDIYYHVVEPDAWSYFSINYGWHYYPFYPGRSRFHRRGRQGFRNIHYYPRFNYGGNLIWVKNVKKANSSIRLPDRTEEIYSDAKITYALTFPELNEEVKDYRLIIPGVNLRGEEGESRILNFEIKFDQIITIDK